MTIGSLGAGAGAGVNFSGAWELEKALGPISPAYARTLQHYREKDDRGVRGFVEDATNPRSMGRRGGSTGGFSRLLNMRQGSRLTGRSGGISEQDLDDNMVSMLMAHRRQRISGG